MKRKETEPHVQRRQPLLTFERHVEYLNNIPHIITTRPIFTADESAYDETRVLQAVARQITNSAERVLSQHFGWTVEQVRERAAGYLVATNLQNASVRDFEIQSTNFDPQIIEDAIIQMQKSNEHVSIFDMEWRVVFYESGVQIGGSRTPRIPKYWLTHKNTWVAHSFRGVEIGCAAYALNWAMNRHKYKNLRIDTHIRDAIRLQQQLDWDVYVSIAQIKEFVVKYPQYKVVIIIPNVLRHHERFIGTQYEDKILTLFYYPDQQHFVSGPTAISIIRKVRNNVNYKWCKTCDLAFTRCIGHTCEALEIAPENYRKPTPCVKCGIVGTHDCELVTCRVCAHVYKKTQGWDHRCIMIQKERRATRQMFQGMPNADPKSPCLYVYDIEARMTMVETNLPYLQHVDTVDGLYQEEYHCVYEKRVQQHTANMVVYKKVFSDEPPVILTGDDCLSVFLATMKFVNNGNNICIAHNASGYDTRLLFAEAVTHKDKINIFPILRGGMLFYFLNSSEIHEFENRERFVFQRLVVTCQGVA